MKDTTQNGRNTGHMAAVPSSGWNWKWFAPPDADAGTVTQAARQAAPEVGCKGPVERTQAGGAPRFIRVQKRPDFWLGLDENRVLIGS